MILRALAVLLLCLNLGAAAWLWWRPAAVLKSPDPAIAEGVVRLQLLSERSVGAQVPPAEPVGECRSLGPFQQIESLRAAMRLLEPKVQSIQMRELPHAQLIGYRVYLQAAPSREAALTRTSQLASRGVRDYYLVTAGAQQNSISLGLFRELANAERRRAELKAKGFAVVLEPRTEDGLRWWIDLVAANAFDWQAALGDTAAELESRPCVGSESEELPAEPRLETPESPDDVPSSGPNG